MTGPQEWEKKRKLHLTTREDKGSKEGAHIKTSQKVSKPDEGVEIHRGQSKLSNNLY